MCNDSINSHKECCLQGPQGVPGLQGSQGVQGIAGAQGIQGIPGLTGMQGPQGLQGIQGPPGSGGSSGCQRYANVFSDVPQTIGAYGSTTDAVIFGKANQISSGDFDMSLKATTGAIKFLKHGIYELSWTLQAIVMPPIPTPIPSWSFGFFINTVLVPGSIYSGWTQSPSDDAAHCSGNVIVEVMAGDVLLLRNTSVNILSLNPNVNGSVFPITIASLSIECLQSIA